MSKINVLDMAGKVVGEIELNDSVFGIEPNTASCMLMSRTTWPISVTALRAL